MMRVERRKYFLGSLFLSSIFIVSLVLVGGLSGVMVGVNMKTPSARPYSAAQSQRGGAPQAPSTTNDEWFMVLRIPEVYMKSDETLAARRLSDWLGALKQSGFTPMLLSDVIETVRRRESLPENPVVLVFQPGYKRTREVLDPILARHGVPALWLTDKQAIHKKDTHYIRPYTAFKMKASGRYDIGYVDGAANIFSLDPAFRNRELRTESISWHEGVEDGRRALNIKTRLDVLHRLNVNLQWSGAQLMRRLATEMPITGRTRLTVINMSGRNWGVPASNALPDAPARFDLLTSPGSRSASIRWDGTTGIADMQVELEARSLSGELWVHLRHDRRTSDGLMVGFLSDGVVVQQAEKGQLLRIAGMPWTRPLRGGISAKIILTENRLEVSAEGLEGRVVDLPMMFASPRGTLGLVVSGKISGVAQAKGIMLYATPLASKD